MGWFMDWWQALGMVGQIMACAAIPMTVVMLLQLVLMIIGIGPSGESDSDTDDGAANDSAGIDHSAYEVAIPGHGHGDGHGNGHGNGHGHSHGNGNSIWKIFTIRGIVAFFALGGWAGLAALTAGIPALWSIQIALLSGAAAMLLASVVIRFALKMQSSGNIDLRNALSHEAEVYITIPPLRENKGKVTMILQERFVELDAVTDCETAIKSGGKVLVTGLAEPGCLIVRPLEGDL